ncbi:MAG TPA: S41 family peptidase [Thermoguttaceae bacterium]|nr:S41 family peptidase [Thermoguttaceae bacterium]
MPRRNFYILFLVTAACVACALQSDRFGRLLVYSMRQIDQRYLEKVDRERLFEGAMQGMTRRIQEEYGDDYTDYVTPADAKPFNEELDAEFGGLGIMLVKPDDDERITVLWPMVDSPAYKAGILAGDVILKIDGQSTEGMSPEKAVKLIHGEIGQPVTLSVLHKGAAKPVDVTVRRAMIKNETVFGDRRKPDGSWEYFLKGEDRIAYVRIEAVAENTPAELRKALDSLTEHGVRGLILDLRFNGGGYLGAAWEICNLFVDSGMIVSTVGRDGGKRQDFTATPGKKYTGFPIAVLVNKYSASAAEIIAACLQDHRRAVIVGQRSYGKGLVQELLYLDHNKGTRRGVLKVTSSSYWRPSGVNINRSKKSKGSDPWGVRPDKGYEVIVKEKDFGRLLLSRRRHELGLKEPEPSGDAKKQAENEPFFDPQLDAAVKYLRKEINERANTKEASSVLPQ